jgi:hypothetical protein
MTAQKSVLTQDELQIVNEMFSLDLDYGNATHYRAAQVIWNLWKADDKDIIVPNIDPEEM